MMKLELPSGLSAVSEKKKINIYSFIIIVLKYFHTRVIVHFLPLFSISGRFKNVVFDTRSLPLGVEGGGLRFYWIMKKKKTRCSRGRFKRIYKVLRIGNVDEICVRERERSNLSN